MELFSGVYNPYFQKYGLLVCSLLALSGAILAVLRLTKLREAKAVSHAWDAWRSWLVMAAVIFGFLAFGRTGFIAGVILLSFAGVKEFSKAVGLYKDKWFMWAVYITLIVTFICCAAPDFGFFMMMPVLGVVLFMLTALYRGETSGVIQKVGLSAIALLYFGWFPSHLAFLTNHPEWPAYVLFLILGVELNDMSGYVFGSIFGRNKLIPNVSPNKSTEGALGGMLMTAVYVYLMRPLLPDFTSVMLVLSFIIIWIGGTAGDLIVSAIKRDVGVKDMGTLIPGHGGILDRADSLIFTAPFFFHMINYLLGLPGTSFLK